ncbi:MAG TPA: antitoxin VapB family protein [Candidatus Nanoarchaeia archaeon]|nr:antitoxin VapB family protein [Candidatus Nanoarchaeia archaeon]
MVKTITVMDDAYEALKSKKTKDESFSDTIRRMCSEKKIDLRQWLGALKGKDRGAAEINKEIMEERAKMSKDLDERIKKLQR